MKHIGKHPMKPGLALGALAFLIAAAGAQSVGADTCDTTRVTSETFQSAEGAVYLVKGFFR
jgi:hypothetical protein